MTNKIRILALYLPQYHPFKENDEWWGKGFTEWTNVGKAKRYFPGHYQPRVPADLGYYDLRVPETREAQAQMAKEYGIEGFLYWHYWFGNGKKLMQRPFDEVVSSGNPDFPFALAWANESWKGFAHGITNRNVLIEQLYPGEQDIIDHFYDVLPAFKDKRYITIDGKPLFMIYKPMQHPQMSLFINIWRKLAKKNGLSGIFFLGQTYGYTDCKETDETILSKFKEYGFDAVNFCRQNAYMEQRCILRKAFDKIKAEVFRLPKLFSYKNTTKYYTKEMDREEYIFPTIISGWDHTPRSKNMGVVLTHYNPKTFGAHLDKVIDVVKDKDFEHSVIILKSWNEWAEGNYLEPDLKYGKQFLEEIQKRVIK